VSSFSGLCPTDTHALFREKSQSFLTGRSYREAVILNLFCPSMLALRLRMKWASGRRNANLARPAEHRSPDSPKSIRSTASRQFESSSPSQPVLVSRYSPVESVKPGRFPGLSGLKPNQRRSLLRVSGANGRAVSIQELAVRFGARPRLAEAEQLLLCCPRDREVHSAEVSTAMMKGVWPRRPRPAPSPVRSPPI
jgi:hypothetical protein